jgi:hypothetical protein
MRVPLNERYRAAAREWIADCEWADIHEREDVERLTDEELVTGVDRHFEGGWIAFVATLEGW